VAELDNAPSLEGNQLISETDGLSELDTYGVSGELYREVAQMGANSKWPTDTKIQAAAYYAVMGSMVQVAKHVGVPKATLYHWVKKPWWKKLVRQVRIAKQDELDSKLTGVIMAAADQLKDRVENGNIKVDTESGKQTRVPLSSSELSKDGIGIPFDKRALLRGDPTAKIERVDSTKVLEQLAEQFTMLANQQPRSKALETEEIEEGQFEVIPNEEDDVTSRCEDGIPQKHNGPSNQEWEASDDSYMEANTGGNEQVRTDVRKTHGIKKEA
jgi:transposase-like protein